MGKHWKYKIIGDKGHHRDFIINNEQDADLALKVGGASKKNSKKIKKSKKHQKGGFIYNPNTKRKKLKSSKNATRSRSSTRKRTYSSKTSRQRSKSSKSSF